MNNRFIDYVKKMEFIVSIRLLTLGILLLSVIIILILTRAPFFLKPFAVFFFGILFLLFHYKKRKKEIKYDLDSVVNNNIYIPLVLDNEYLRKISCEFNNSVNLTYSFKNLADYVQFMIDNNQMIFLEEGFKLEDLIELINKLIHEQKFDLVIDKNDITKEDDDIIKLRRKDKVANDLRDLNIIKYILEDNQLELICFYSPFEEYSSIARIDGYVLGVFDLSKLETLKQYKYDLAIKIANKLRRR